MSLETMVTQQEQDALLPEAEADEGESALASKTWHFKRLSLLLGAVASLVLLTVLVTKEEPSFRGKEAIQYSDPVEVAMDQATKEYSTYSYDAQPAGNTMYSNHQTPQTAYGPAPTVSSTSYGTANSQRCILCSPNQCTLDYSGHGAWTSCPASKKYFSEAHCKCVSSCSSDPSPKVPTCSLCENCYTKACNIGGKYLQCGQATPYWEPNKKTCASACQPPPGPAPAPYSQKHPTPQPMQAPTPAPVSQMTPSLAPSPSPHAASCHRDTGGKCSWSSCDGSRGKTSCKSGKCYCSHGYCSFNGKCLSEAEYQKQMDAESRKCYTDTGVSCRWHSCDKKMGLTMCDSLTEGHGSYNCLCKKHYCWDKVKEHCVRQH